MVIQNKMEKVKEQIVENLTKYVKDKIKEDQTGHDWFHIQRVYHMAMRIKKEEKADEFVITVITLLHDLYDHKFYQEEPKEKIEGLLEKIDTTFAITQQEKENIIHSCIYLGFSENLVKKQELSIEGKIVQDADRLDALGAIGIVRTFTYGGKTGKPIYDPNINDEISQEEYKTKGSYTSISHFYDKLLKIKELMNTNAAKIIAEQRHQFTENFLQEFLEEWDGIK